MKKYFLSAALILFTPFAFPIQYGYCKSQTPEELVRDFYIWYFKTYNENLDPENSPELYKYVAAETAEYIQKNPPQDIFYFTKATMAGSVWRTAKAAVAKSVPLGSDIFIVPVTIKIRDKDYQEDFYVVAFVKKENKNFYITKVVDIYPYF